MPFPSRSPGSPPQEVIGFHSPDGLLLCRLTRKLHLCDR